MLRFLSDQELSKSSAICRHRRFPLWLLFRQTSLRARKSQTPIQKAERELRNRVRSQLGLPLYEPTLDPKKRAVELGITSDYDLPLPNGNAARRHNDLKLQTLFFREDLDRKLSALRESTRVLLQDAGLSFPISPSYGSVGESENGNQWNHGPTQLGTENARRTRALRTGSGQYSSCSLRGKPEQAARNRRFSYVGCVWLAYPERPSQSHK